MTNTSSTPLVNNIPLHDAITIEQAYETAGADAPLNSLRGYGDNLSESQEAIDEGNLLEIAPIIRDIRPHALKLNSRSPVLQLYRAARARFVEVVHANTGTDPDEITTRLNMRNKVVEDDADDAADVVTETPAPEANTDAVPAPTPAPDANPEDSDGEKKPLGPGLPCLNDIVLCADAGIYRVAGLDTQSVAGLAMQSLVLISDYDKIKLLVPVKKTAERILPMPTSDMVKRALEVTKGKPRRPAGMAARWMAANEAKLKSHDIVSVAEVIRDLRLDLASPTCSFTARQQIDRAALIFSQFYAFANKASRGDGMAVLNLDRYTHVDKGVGTSPHDAPAPTKPAGPTPARKRGKPARPERGTS